MPRETNNKTSSSTRHAIDIRLDPEIDQQRLEETDVHLALALQGDEDAAAYIAITYSATMLEEARAILGPGMWDEAEDVVQDILAGPPDRLGAEAHSGPSASEQDRVGA